MTTARPDPSWYRPTPCNALAVDRPYAAKTITAARRRTWSRSTDGLWWLVSGVLNLVVGAWVTADLYSVFLRAPVVRKGLPPVHS